MNRISIRILMLLSIFSVIFAQAPPMEWHKGYGTNNGEHVHEGMQTSDGGYIAIGQTDEGRGEAADMLVVKVDPNGEFEWQTIIGRSGKLEVGMCIDEVSDGFIAGGGLYTRKSKTQQRALVKLDRKGKIVWKRTYPGKQNGSIRGIDITAEGDIIATGYTNASRDGFIFIVEEGTGSLMKLNPKGKVIWEQEFASTPQGTKVLIDHSTGDLAVCSTVWRTEEGKDAQQDMMLIVSDSKGNLKWERYYGAENLEHCYDFDLTDDGGYILGGHTRSYGVINWDLLLMKIDSKGDEEWHRTFGQPRDYDPKWIHDEAYGVKQTPDGDYVLVAGTGDEYRYSAEGHELGSSDIWMAYLVKTDGDGNTLWEGVYGDPKTNDAGEYVNLCSDGGYIIFTDTDNAGAENFKSNNFGFMKIAPDVIK